MFYIFEASTYNDGTKKSLAVYERETKTEALGMFHKKLGAAMSSTNYETELVKVMNGEGVEIPGGTGYWERPHEEQ